MTFVCLDFNKIQKLSPSNIFLLKDSGLCFASSRHILQSLWTHHLIIKSPVNKPVITAERKRGEQTMWAGSLRLFHSIFRDSQV